MSIEGREIMQKGKETFKNSESQSDKKRHGIYKVRAACCEKQIEDKGEPLKLVI